MRANPAFPLLARTAMDAAVRYRAESAPPRPTATLAELRQRFGGELPEQGMPGEAVIEQLVTAADGGLSGTTGPNFYAWVMGASHPVGVAAEWLVTTWGQNAGTYDTAPAAAVAEETVSTWLLEMLDLPRDCSVGFSTGATMASTICLAAARSQVLQDVGYCLEKQGMFGAPSIGIFLGEEAHASIESGLRYLGFGNNDMVRIAVDNQGRMLASELADSLSRHKGPAIVICQAGHMLSGDFDPVGEIADIAQRHGAWCHVDGAFGLWSRTVPELVALCPGLDRADSWAVDGHKWLQVPYDLGFAILRNSQAHRRVMDTSASYLGEPPAGARCPSQYCPELSRRARGFAAWAVFQALGRQGIREMVQRHCNCARQLAHLAGTDSRIEVLNEVVLNQVALSFGPGLPEERRTELTDAVAAELASRNKVFLECANWRGRRVLRVSVTSRETGPADIDRLVDEIRTALDTVCAQLYPQARQR